MTDRFPRVAFLTSAAFNRVTGGGITFGNLFRGWPKDRLATVHNDPVPTTDETCERYFVLTPAEVGKWGPFEAIAPAPAAGSFAVPAAAERAASPRRRVLRAAKRIVFGDRAPDAGRLTPRLAAWLEDFRPQVLYTILGSNAMMELALAIRARFDVPLVIHIMDDWLATAYRGGIAAPFARARMERLFAEVSRVAAARLGICDAMCRAYEARYGVPFEPFQNAVEVGRWSANARREPAASSARELVYIGSILPFAQLDSLADCCAAVARLGRAGEAVRLSIYSPAHDLAQWRDRLLLGPNIAVADTIQDDAALFARLQSADALLLPVNFDPHTVRYIRYSMPTKVPAYLAAGSPILAYGPGEVAQIQYAAEAGWAHVLGERSPAKLEQAIRAVLDDVPLRARLAERSLRVAAERHDIERVRPRFQAVLAAAAAGSGR
jgi:glycosyltransferase involved in cell wall biosynthesis